MDKFDFSKRLAELRMNKGVSARDMSLSIGQSAGYINNIENGVNLPSMSTFFYICEFLQIKAKDFFDTGASNPEKLNEIMEDLKRLDAHQLDNISKVIKDLIKRE